MNLIVLAIPVFFLLIAIEVLWTLWEEKRFYRLADAVSDLSCGILEQVAGLFLKTAVFAGYLLVYERFRLTTIPCLPPWPGSPAGWGWTSSTTGSTARATRSTRAGRPTSSTTRART